MTKHFSPEPGTTEPIGTEYIRALDDGSFTIMVEAELGCFVRKLGAGVAAPEVTKPPRATPLNKRHVVGKSFWRDFWETTAIVKQATVESPRDASEPYYIDTFSLWYGDKEVIDLSLKPLPVGRPINRWRVNEAAMEEQALCVEPIEASKSRARQEKYSIEHPENDSEIFPRKPRNASPSREKPSLVLNALMKYRGLNESFEPVQTIYGKVDGEKYLDGVDYAEDDVPQPAVDAELENRPSVEEMEARCANVVRMYPLAFLPFPWLYKPVPVVVGVECIGHRKGTGLEEAARKSLAAYAQSQATSRTPHWPRAKDPNDAKQIGIVVDRIAKQERLNINDVGMNKRWSVRRIGGLRFESSDRTHRWLGQLTQYVNAKNPKRWHSAKEDVAGTPRGPAFLGSADQNDKEDMAKKGWQVLTTPKRKTTMA
jgi:hypothetical protein